MDVEDVDVVWVFVPSEWFRSVIVTNIEVNKKGLSYYSNSITYALQSPMKTTARMNKMFMMKYKTRLS